MKTPKEVYEDLQKIAYEVEEEAKRRGVNLDDSTEVVNKRLPRNISERIQIALDLRDKGLISDPEFMELVGSGYISNKE